MSNISKRPGIVRRISLRSSILNHYSCYRRTLAILILLLLLALVVIVGGDVNLQAFSDISDLQSNGAVSGSFIQMPLDTTQVNDLGHLMNHMQYKQLAKLYVSHMTLDEKLGQLFMVQSYDQYYSPALEMMVDQLHAGGVIMYAFQMQTFQQTRHDILETQQHATIPLIIAADEEGGYVERVQNIFGHHPGALEIYETGNVNLATQAGNRIARDLQSLGINAYLRAVQGDGEIACLKHFPGLGAASTDAHYDLPVIKRSAAQIYSVELAPFKAFIQSKNKLDNPGMIMSTDLLMPAIDPTMPAELSHIFMTDILRNQLGYDGVVITDALWMTGIAEKWNLAQAGVLALNAGNDMLLGAIGPYQMMDMINGLKAALQDGTLSMARLNEAVTRIIALKMQYHIIPVIQA